MKLEFTVYGKPEPQGSTRAFLPKGSKHPIITSDNPNLKSWRQEIAKTAFAVAQTPFPKETAVRVAVQFFFAKPKSAAKREWPTVKPDIDKTLRACLDAMTGIVWVDDSQVCFVAMTKHYGLPERAEFEVSAL